MSGLMTPEGLSREGSPTPEHMIEVSQSAPGSPGSTNYGGGGGVIGHQQMSALVGATKTRLLMSQRAELQEHVQLQQQQGPSQIQPSNGQEYREGIMVRRAFQSMY